VWSVSVSDPDKEPPNVTSIHKKLDALVEVLPARLAAAADVRDEERAAYEESVHYLLYQRYHSHFVAAQGRCRFYREFLAGAAQAVIWDRPELLALRRDQDTEIEVVPYDVPDLRLEEGGSRFQWRGNEVRLGVPGAHNALNATAALEAARLAGADAKGAIEGLAGFEGAGRRFQRLGETGGAVVYDDYAHHPTEVAATLRAARTLAHRRLVAVFQPHLYSRTALLAREFGVALALADVVVVLDVYPARERGEDHPGVSGLKIAEATADVAAGRPVYWLPSFTEAESVLQGILEQDDVCLVMGAGDVDRLGRRLVGIDRV